MATKTKSSKSTKAAKKTAAIKSGPLPPYGITIREAASRGDLSEMRKASTAGHKWLKGIQTALGTLEKAISKKTLK